MSSSFVQNFFTHYFPAPRFLEMPAVGLDISDDIVRFAELKRDHDHYKLGIYGEKAIPTDVIEQGFIKNIDGLAKVLRELKEQYKLEFVKVSLPEEKAYLFRLAMPIIDEADIPNALKFKIEENVPITLQNAVFDYTYIKKPEPKDNHYDIGVAVMHTKVVLSYMQALKNAGLTPVVFRTEAQAIAKAVIAPDDNDTYILIGLRETKTVLAIVSQGVVQFTSTLSVGAESITESIKKQFAVDKDEAEKIRTGQEIKESSEMFQSLVNAGSVLRDEVQKLFTYWNGHAEVSEGHKIQHIILTGADALLGLDSYLARSFEVPVQIANAWKNILSIETEIPPLTKRESLDYIPALGLAMPYD